MATGEKVSDFLLKYLRISAFSSSHADYVEFSSPVVHLVHQLVRNDHALVGATVDVDSAVAAVNPNHLEIRVLDFDIEPGGILASREQIGPDSLSDHADFSLL